MSDLSELMGTDPLRLTREDRAQIIAKMREDRGRYLAGAKAEKAPAAPRQKVAKGTLNLNDLDL